MNSGSVTHWIQQLRDNDPNQREDAAQQIFCRYFQQLVGLATSNLAPAIQQRIAGADVAQSAIKSFFVRQRQGEFTLQGRGDLETLLIKITLNKVRSVARRHTAQQRDVRREARPVGPEGLAPWVLEHMATAAPTQEEAAVIRDAIDSLPHAQWQHIVLLRLAGYTDVEISEQLELSGESIRIKRQRIKQKWEKLFEISTDST